MASCLVYYEVNNCPSVAVSVSGLGSLWNLALPMMTALPRGTSFQVPVIKKIHLIQSEIYEY